MRFILGHFFLLQIKHSSLYAVFSFIFYKNDSFCSVEFLCICVCQVIGLCLANKRQLLSIDVSQPSALSLSCLYLLVLTHLFLILISTMIQNMIKEGKIVPSEVTIRLLQQAIKDNGNDKFLIDGFPRNEENRAAFERVVIANCYCHQIKPFHLQLSSEQINVLPSNFLNASLLSRLEQSQHLSCILIAQRKRWRDDFLVGTRLYTLHYYAIICTHFLMVSVLNTGYQ